MLRNEEILRTLLMEVLVESEISYLVGKAIRDRDQCVPVLAGKLAAKIQEGRQPVDEAANVGRLKRLLTETFDELQVRSANRYTEIGRWTGTDLATDAAPILARKLREG